MLTVSAHITGFFHSTYHAYTTEVVVDGYRYRLGLRYSTFHQFYDKLCALGSGFEFAFPPKGTLFFSPKPEERQEQLEAFLQAALAHFEAQGRPKDMAALVEDLLQVPEHLKGDADEKSKADDREHNDEDDDSQTTSDESVPDEEHAAMVAHVTSEAAGEPVEEDEEEHKTVVADAQVEEPAVAETALSVQEAETEAEVASEPVAEAAVKVVHVEKEEDESVSEPAAKEEEEPVQAVVEDVEPVVESEREVEEEERVDDGSVVEEALESEDVEGTAVEPVASTEKEKEIIEAEAVETWAEVEDEVVDKPRQEDAMFPCEVTVEEVEHEDDELVAEVAAKTVEVRSAEPEEAAASCVSSFKPEEAGKLSTELPVGRPSFFWGFVELLRPASLLRFLRWRPFQPTNFMMLCVALVLPFVFSRE